MTSDFMNAAATQIGGRGILVARFNFVYAELGKKAPDRQPILEETYREVVTSLHQVRGEGRTVIGGKSLGGRIASHVAPDLPVEAVVLFGYPLHPPGRPDRIRDAHLSRVVVPMLFVEGTRDPFCPLETLADVRSRLPGPTDLIVVDDGDHSFKVRKSSGRSTEQAWNEAFDGAAAWLA